MARAWSGCCVLVPAPHSRFKRLDLVDDQHVVYRLPRAQRDGSTVLSLTPLGLIDHLAALIPPPKLHRHRYHGVLAPSCPMRTTVTA
jgi:hypothetical protein